MDLNFFKNIFGTILFFFCLGLRCGLIKNIRFFSKKSEVEKNILIKNNFEFLKNEFFVEKNMEPEQVIELVKSLDETKYKNRAVNKIIRRIRNGKYTLNNQNIMCKDQIVCSYDEFNDIIETSNIDNLVIVYSRDYSNKVYEMENFEQISKALVYDITGILDQRIFNKVSKPNVFSNLIVMDRIYYNLIMFMSSLID